ncbi:hypothetical protein LJC46_04890 [Desulfovibrio sp. OttesenSCG-928-G15]|nr:hypothetical protein [Desulfovibrio sp. OttesenSCG-928-G15]
MKKILGIIVVVAVIAAAVGAFVYLPGLDKDMENGIAAYIESLPGDLKADKIKVSYLDKSVSIQGLKGTVTYFEGTQAEVNLATLTLEGCHFTASTVKGIRPIADKWAVSDVQVVTTSKPTKAMQEALKDMDMPAVAQSVHIKQAEGKSISGDLLALGKIVQENLPQAQTMEAISSIVLGDIKVTGYESKTTVADQPLVMSVADFTGKEMSMRTAREHVWNTINVTLGGQGVLSIGKITLAKMSMPDFTSPVIEALEKGMGEDVLVDKALSALKSEPLVLEGLVMEDVKCLVPLAAGTTLARYSLDLKATDAKLHFKNSFTELKLPVDTYKNLSMEAAMFAASYGKDFLLNGNLDFDLERKNDTMRFTIADLAFSDPSLASIDFSGSFQPDGKGSSLGDIMENSSDVYLEKAALSVVDHGAVDLAFKLAMLMDKNANPDAAALQKKREEVALGAEQAAKAHPSEDIKKILQGVVQLIRHPNSQLDITLSPEQPVAFSSDMDHLGATVTFKENAAK